MYSIGYLIYGLDATFSQYSQSECAGKVLRCLQQAIAKDPASFHYDPEDNLDHLTDEEDPHLDELGEIMTESLNCWSTYSGTGDATPCALGVELGSFTPTSNYPLSKLCKDARVTLEIQADYKKVLEALPEAFAKRLKDIVPMVFVIWGTS